MVPVSYAVLAMELATEHGVPQETVLQDIDLPAEVLSQPEARIPMRLYGRITARSLHLCGDKSLGIQFGLRSTLTSHGFLGLGIMSQRTLREALEFAIRFITKLRFPAFDASLLITRDQTVLDLCETAQLGTVRTYAFEALLTIFTHVLQLRTPIGAIEMWFAWPEPNYFDAYRNRLPVARFHTGVNQLRFPTRYLDVCLETANARTVQLVTDQCERELAVLGRQEDVVERVRVLLTESPIEILDLETIAVRLCVSTRTLKRKLKQRGFTYRHLCDEIRYRRSIELLRIPSQTIESIAGCLGYTCAANFSRAFVRWAGIAPGAYRVQLLRVYAEGVEQRLGGPE